MALRCLLHLCGYTLIISMPGGMGVGGGGAGGGGGGGRDFMKGYYFFNLMVPHTSWHHSFCSVYPGLSKQHLA